MKTEFQNIYINRYGYVFPSCKTYRDKPIGLLTDPGIKEKVFAHFGHEFRFYSITVEFSSACHAACLYCFQRDGDYRRYEYFDELHRFLLATETERLFCSGGEILDQGDTMEFLSRLRDEMPDTLFHLKTNGNADLSYIFFVDRVFDSSVISFNGFSDSTCRLVMGPGVDVEKTKTFAKKLIEDTTVNVGLKYLISPATIAELPAFLKWALGIKPRCAILQTAYRYRLLDNGISIREGLTFDDPDNLYWKPLLDRLRGMVSGILHSTEINLTYNRLACDSETADLIGLSGEDRALFRMDGIYDLEDDA